MNTASIDTLIYKHFAHAFRMVDVDAEDQRRPSTRYKTRDKHRPIKYGRTAHIPAFSRQLCMIILLFLAVFNRFDSLPL